MALSCICNFDGDFDWYYQPPEDYQVLNESKRKRCASCKTLSMPLFGAHGNTNDRWSLSIIGISNTEEQESHMVTKDEFDALSPVARGYVVYTLGCREDEPNVPDETNPYPEGSTEQLDWARGMTRAVHNAQDSEE